MKLEPCPQPHPSLPVSANGYLTSDSNLCSKVSESVQLQSMINDALPPSLDLVVSPTLTTKDLLVKAPPTRSDSVTSEVEDDSYSIPSMTSSIQELINNNNNSNDNNDDDGLIRFEQENQQKKNILIASPLFFLFIFCTVAYLHNVSEHAH